MSAMSTAAPRLISESSCLRNSAALVTSMCSGKVTIACRPAHSTGKSGLIDKVLEVGGWQATLSLRGSAEPAVPVPGRDQGPCRW
jgi:hypothetical protein